MRYPLTFYVKSLPPNVGGTAKMAIIRILEKYRDDEGIYQHELMHIKQWARLAILGIPFAAVCYYIGKPEYASLGILFLVLHNVLYTVIPKYRLAMEVEAFKEQLKHYPDDRRARFAEFISTHYGLKITKEEALKRLPS